METQTDPFNNIGIFNGGMKKKPHNITIKNYNPNEPKSKPNMKYSEKQRYRNYKTRTEPKLYNRIKIDEEDNIINVIKEAFGIEKDKKRNYSNVETSGATYYKEPITQEQEDDEFQGIPRVRRDYSNLSIDTNIQPRLKLFEDLTPNEEPEKAPNVLIDLLKDYEDPSEKPPPSPSGSIITELSVATTIPTVMSPKDQFQLLTKRQGRGKSAQPEGRTLDLTKGTTQLEKSLNVSVVSDPLAELKKLQGFMEKPPERSTLLRETIISENDKEPERKLKYELRIKHLGIEGAKHYIIIDLEDMRQKLLDNRPNLVDYHHMSQDEKDEAARNNKASDKKVNALTKEISRVRLL